MCRHRDVLLHHLRLNGQKSVLTPSQQTIERESSFQSPCVLGLLQAQPSCSGGHMSQASGAQGSSLSCAALHMRPFLWWMKLRGICPSWSAFRLLRVSRSCLRSLEVESFVCLDRHAHRLLLWAQDRFLSLRTVHVPGDLNIAADFLSRQKLKSGEWMSKQWLKFGACSARRTSLRHRARHSAPCGFPCLIRRLCG